MTRPTAIPVAVSMAMIHSGLSALTPNCAGRLLHSTRCSSAATFIATIRIRLQAIPIRMAGTDRISIVLARGWSMEMSL